MTSIATGKRFYSAASTVELIVVKGAEVLLACAGEPMLEARAEQGSGAAQGEQIAIGKRYTDEESGLLVLCTKAGPGPLTADGRELHLLAAKPLPSSD